MKKEITYKDAGVDIDAGQESLRRIAESARSTHTDSVLTGLGGFGSLFDIGPIVKEYREPVLVQSADGVGTKLMVANMMNRYDTVGIDIVNHCCNDILCQGAKPLTFLDYIAVETLKPEQIEQLVKGMAKACRDNGVSLVGGETAELPGTYAKGEYDLVGVITGIVEKSKIVTGQNIVPGDKLLGLASSGLHTNGYTLARKVIFDTLEMGVDTAPPELGQAVGTALLEPHKDYSQALLPLFDEHNIKGLAHITDGGLPGNLSRVLPTSCDAVIKKGSWDIPPLFQLIASGGLVPSDDMYRTFNMGIGMVIVTDPDSADGLATALESAAETVFAIGEIVADGSGTVRLA